MTKGISASIKLVLLLQAGGVEVPNRQRNGSGTAWRANVTALHAPYNLILVTVAGEGSRGAESSPPAFFVSTIYRPSEVRPASTATAWQYAFAGNRLYALHEKIKSLGIPLLRRKWRKL